MECTVGTWHYGKFLKMELTDYSLRKDFAVLRTPSKLLEYTVCVYYRILAFSTGKFLLPNRNQLQI